MKENRKLAAIMFTDIAGYTALMSRDEQKVMQILKKNHVLQKSLAKKYHGEFLKEMGDGTLLCFQSALDAVRCGVAIQEAVKDDPELNLRIGIHLGDIIFKDGDVFGDGVNVASRIENTAEPGSICFSAPIYEAIKNKPDIRAEYLEQKHLKHVPDPVEIYIIKAKPSLNQKSQNRKPASAGGEKPAKWKMVIPICAVIAAVLGVLILKNPFHRMSDGYFTQENSIAVLPFSDLSPAGDQEYFCDGMIEAIIGQLSRIENLKVISRMSVVVYRNVPKDLREIARELGVTHALEGSVQREGEAIRVTAKLIDAESGFQVWSGKYDRAMAGVFAIQDEISQAIAGALKLELRADARAAAEAVRPDDMALYETYLQGMYFISSRYVLTYQEEDFVQAVQKLEEAKAMAPKYANSYLGLAWAYWHRYQITESPDDMANMCAHIETGYRLNPDLAESNMGKAFIHFQEGDFDQAFEKYRIALERGRNRYEIHIAIGYTYQRMGLYEQAIPFLSRVNELAPFYLFGKANLARCHMFLGEFDKAESLLREALALNPRNPFSLLYLATCLLQVGKIDEAGQIFTELERTDPDFYMLPQYKADLHAARGERVEALKLYPSPSVYALLGMRDEAIQSMMKAESEGTFYLYLRLIHDPFYKNLRSDPRFEQIVSRAKERHGELLKKYGEFGITSQ